MGDSTPAQHTIPHTKHDTAFFQNEYIYYSIKQSMNSQDPQNINFLSIQ